MHIRSCVRSPLGLALAATVFIALDAFSQTLLFDVTNSWSYQQSTNLDGVSWMTPGFDDTRWPSGPGLLYVEDNSSITPRNTPLVLGDITYYFRTHFDFPGGVNGAVLIFSNRIDDGAVFYLNGTEVQRVRMAPGTVNYTNLATSTPGLQGDATGLDVFTLSGPSINYLHSGDNLLAVEVHQVTSDSSDIVFGASLSYSNASAPIVITGQPNNCTVLDGRPAIFSVATTGSGPVSLQWLKNGFPIPGATNTAYIIKSATQSDAGNYSVVLSNFLCSVSSVPATLNVIPDVTPPILTSAVSLANSNTVLLSFSEELDPASATNAANYYIFEKGNSANQLPIYSAVLTDLTNVVLTTAPRSCLCQSVSVSNVTDIATLPNPVLPDTVAPLSYVLQLIAINDTTYWKYDSSGGAPSSSWTTKDFDDSSWSNGLALFEGNRNSFPVLQEPVRTVLNLTNTAGTSQVVTYYFRKFFDSLVVPNNVNASLELHQVVDDGAVFYLNGAEVFSSRMPSGRPLNNETLASASVGTAGYFPPLAEPGFFLSTSNLVPGSNIFAVEVHQSSVNNSDVTFGAVLETTLRFAGRITVTVPTSAREGDGLLSSQGLVAVSPPPERDLLLALTSDRLSEIALPPSVSIAAGQTNAHFNITILDDQLLDGPQTVFVSASANGYGSGASSLTVQDNDSAVLSVSIPGSLIEGASAVTGVVTTAQTPLSDFSVSLASSDTNILTVPASVLLRAGQTSAVFTAKLPENALITGPRFVTVSAQVTNWIQGQTTVQVADNEAAVLSLSLPNSGVEGDGVRTNAGRVWVTGVLLTNLTVTLNSSDAAKLLLPDTVTIPAGQSNAAFNVTFPDNLLPEASKTVSASVSASGFTGTNLTITVMDNDPDHFTFSPIGQIQTTGATFSVTITAWDVSGAIMTQYKGRARLQATGLEGSLPVQPTNTPPFFSGRCPVNVKIGAPGTSVRLFCAEAPGTSDSFDVGLPMFYDFLQRIIDVGWHTQSGRLFATAPSKGGGAYTNQLLAIDPVTMSVTDVYPLANDPGLIEISADGDYLYVTVSNLTAMQRFDLITRQVRPPFAISSNSYPQKTIFDFCIPAGATDAVVVMTYDRYETYLTYGGLFRFDNQQPVLLTNFSSGGGRWLEPSPVPGEILFSRPLLIGQALPSAALATVPGFQGETARYREGCIYDVNGNVFSADSLAYLGTYPEVNANFVEVDPSLRRVFFLQYIDCINTLTVYDRDLFQRIGSFRIVNSGSSVTRFTRCGTNGLAFVAGERLWFVRPDLLQPQRPPTDLSLTLIPLAPQAFAGSNYSFTLTLSNAGPGMATLGSVTNCFPLGTTLIQASPSTGSVLATNNGFAWNFSALPAGATASLQVTVRFANAGWQTNTAWALTLDNDPVFTNNVCQWIDYVQLPPNALGVFPLNAISEDLLYDPVRDRLLLSIGQGIGEQTNGIGVLNPYTGVLESFVKLSGKPTCMARSDDGRYLYVSLKENAVVEKMDLPSLTSLSSFGLDGEDIYGTFYPYYAADMAVVPGRPDSLVVWRVRTAGPMASESSRGLALVENGILRSNVITSGGYSVEFDSDTGTLYSADGGANIYRCIVNSDGVSFSDKYVSLAPNVRAEVEYAGGHLINISGRAISAQSLQVEGIYSGSESALLVEPDAANDRAFFLTQSGNEWLLNAHAFTNYDLLGSLVVSNVNGTPSSLVRWGTDGLAFQTTNQIFLVRTSLRAADSKADLAVFQSGPASPVNSGADMVFNLVVTNCGPDAASALVLTQQCSSGIILTNASASLGDATVSNNVVTWMAPSLEAGGACTITVTARSSAPGLVTSTAILSASTTDPVPQNNTAVSIAQAGVSISSNSILQIQLPARNLVWWPERGKILATVSSGLPNWSNGIVSISPESGEINYEAFVGRGANEMAFSGDRTTLFVSMDYAIQMLSLPSLQQTERFLMGQDGDLTAPWDIAPLPGSSNSLAVLRLTRGYAGDIAVFDGTVMRSNTGAMFNDYYTEILATGGDASVLYSLSHGAGGFRRYSIDSGGVTLVDANTTINPLMSTFFLEWGDGFFYTSFGKVIDPTVPRQVGTVPGVSGISSTSLMKYDAPSRRIFYLLPNGNTASLQAFDTNTFALLGSAVVNGVSGTPSSLIRWGGDGLAFLTSGGQVFLVHTPLLPTNPPTDLSITMAAVNGPYAVGSSNTIDLLITNLGPNSASGVSWSNALPRGSTVLSATASSGTVETNGGAIRGLIDNLSADSSVAVHIVFRPTTTGFFSLSAGVSSSALDLVTSNNLASALIWVQPAGGIAASSLFDLSTKDLIRDASGSKLFASFGASAGVIGNSVVIIDPANGNISRPCYLGGDPGRMAVSADGQYLYVALDGDRAVQRIRLSDMALDFRFVTPNSLVVTDIAVDPTDPDLVALRCTSGGISLHEHGVKRPNDLSGQDLFAFSDTTGDFYACNSGYSGFPLYRVEKGPTGLTLVEGQAGKQSQVTDMKFSQGLLYFSRGMVLNPETRRVMAVMPFSYNSLVEPDPKGNRVFSFSSSGSTGTLRAFSGSDFIELGATNISGISGTPNRLIRWGGNGIAFRTETQVFIGQTGLAPTNPPADLALSSSVSASQVLVDSNVSFTLTLTNQGPGTALGVLAGQSFSLPLSNISLFTSQGAASMNSTSLIWNVGSLNPAARATLTAVYNANQTGTLCTRSSVRHNGDDPDLGNNGALNIIGITTAYGTNVMQLNLVTRELAYDSASGQLFASIPASEPALANSVIAVDPATASIARRFRSGPDPDQLAVSDDGHYLYVSENGAMGVRRLDLLGNGPDLEFPFSLDSLRTAFDIKVQPAHPETIAVSYNRPEAASGSWSQGVAIYDNAVARTNVSSYYESSRFLQFSADGTRLFGWITFGAGYGFLRLAVTPGGIEAVDINYTFYEDNDSRFDNGLLYGQSGRVINPTVPVPIGTNDASGPVVPDSSIGRVLYLVQTNSNWELRAFEMGTYRLIGVESIPGVQGTPDCLIRCGADRIAFRTSNQVFIVGTTLIPTSPVSNADLVLTQTASQDTSSVPAGPVIFSVTLSNRGPADLNAVSVSDILPGPISSFTAQPSQGQWTCTDGLTLLWNAGALPAYQTAHLQLKLSVTNTMMLTNFASAIGDISDPDNSNNTSSATTMSIYFQPQDSLRRVPIATMDLAYDRLRTRLYASLVDTNQSPKVIWLNPISGKCEGSFAVQEPPEFLALSDDAQYLYVSFATTSLIQRIHLPSGIVDFSFPVPGRRARIIGVLPGHPESLAIAYYTTNTYLTGIFDNGVPRPNQIQDLPFSLLAMTPDANYLYGYAWTCSGACSWLYRMSINSSGLTLLSSGPWEQPWGSTADMDYYAGKLYTGNGEIYKATNWAMDVPFPRMSYNQLVELNPSINRIAYLVGSSFSIYELSSHRQLDYLNLLGVHDSVADLTFCDADRLAFRTSEDIFFVRNSQIPTDPSANLFLEGTSDPTNATVGNPIVYSFKIYNYGPNTASNLVLRLPLTNSFLSGPILSSQGSFQTNGDFLNVGLGTLPKDSNAFVSINITGAVTGLITNTISIHSSAYDADMGNNSIAFRHNLSLPQISITNAHVAEGNFGLTNACFNVWINAASVLTNITVGYTALPGTATAGEDFLALSGTLTFSPGTNSVRLILPVHGDIVPEDDETFSVSLSNAVNATLGVSSGICTIMNDDGIAGELSGFQWGISSAPIYSNAPFQATLTAVDFYGNQVKKFSEKAKITGQISKLIVTNGDFETGSLAPWQPLFESNASVFFDTSGHGQISYAYRFSPSQDCPGLKQCVFLRGGIHYRCSLEVALSLENNTSLLNFTDVHMLLNTNEVASYNFNALGSIIDGPLLLRTNLTGYFLAPTNGLYDLKVYSGRMFIAHPALWTIIDNVQITPLDLPILRPETVQFTNGLWAGEICLDGALTNMYLHADDAKGHWGDSDPLDVLSPSDNDHDQTPDNWELAHGLNPTVNDADLDPDRDGLTNLKEFLAGTDPHDPHSVLRLSLISDPIEKTNFALTFTAQPFKTYSIHYTDQLNPPVWNWLTNVPATENARTFRLPVGPFNSKRFYRIVTPQMESIPNIPQFNSIRLRPGGTNAIIRFDAAANTSYALESADQLGPTNWSTLTNSITSSTNRVVEWIIPVSNSKRFFRLRN